MGCRRYLKIFKVIFLCGNGEEREVNVVSSLSWFTLCIVIPLFDTLVMFSVIAVKAAVSHKSPEGQNLSDKNSSLALWKALENVKEVKRCWIWNCI